MSKPKKSKKGCFILILILIVIGGIGAFISKKDWEKNRTEVLAKIEKNLDAGKLEEANEIIEEYKAYSHDDEHYQKLISRAEALAQEAKLEAKRKEIENLTNEIRASGDKSNLLIKLIELDPNNQEFKTEIATIKKKQRKAKAAADKIAKRKKQISAQFSTWDDSHIATVKYIKDNMKDPDSFKHIKTNYWDMKDHLVVIVNYSGKNSFGARVPGWVKTKVDIDGSNPTVIESSE